MHEGCANLMRHDHCGNENNTHGQLVNPFDVLPACPQKLANSHKKETPTNRHTYPSTKCRVRNKGRDDNVCSGVGEAL
jgi:hypothetical protein